MIHLVVSQDTPNAGFENELQTNNQKTPIQQHFTSFDQSFNSLIKTYPNLMKTYILLQNINI